MVGSGAAFLGVCETIGRGRRAANFGHAVGVYGSVIRIGVPCEDSTFPTPMTSNMSTLPPTEAILLEIHKSLGCHGYPTTKKEKFASAQDSVASHRAMFEELLRGIFGALDLDPPRLLRRDALIMKCYNDTLMINRDGGSKDEQTGFDAPYF